MKKTLMLLFGLSAFLAGSVVMQAQKSDANAKVLAMEQKWTDAYRNADISTMTSFLDDDVIVTVEDGSTFGKSGYIAHSKASSGKVDVAEISDVKVRMHGSNVAVVTGAYHEKGKDSKNKPYELHDRFTDVWMAEGANWHLIASQYAVPQK